MEPIDPVHDGDYLDDLDRFWDDLVAGAPVTPLRLGRADTVTVRRLGEAGQALAPDPAFLARLGGDLLGPAPRPLAPALTVAPIALPAVEWDGPADRSERRPQPRRGRRRFGTWFVTQFATAAIVLLTIGAIYVSLGRQTSAPAPGYMPMLGGGAARTGAVPGPGPVASPVVRWQFQAQNLVLSTAAIADGVVFVGSTDDFLYALDTETGGERWRFRTAAGISSSPAVVAGTVFVGAGGPESNQGAVYAVDAATGQERWHFGAGAVFSSPAVVAGVVYVGSNDSNLYALDAATGQVRWSVATGGDVVSSPAVADGVVYAGSGDGNLYAVAADTGTPRWQARLDASVAATPAVVDGLVYVVSDAGSLYAVDAATGQTRWQVGDGGEGGASVAVADGLVYAAGSTLKARDAATGQLRWEFRFGKGNYDLAAPIVARGVVYLGSQSYAGTISRGRSSSGLLFALDAADGTELWHLEVGQVWLAAPAVVDGVAYVGTADATLVAVSDADHTVRAPS